MHIHAYAHQHVSGQLVGPRLIAQLFLISDIEAFSWIQIHSAAIEKAASVNHHPATRQYGSTPATVDDVVWRRQQSLADTVAFTRPQ